MFDGEKMAEDDAMQDSEIGDLDEIDVHIK